MNCEHFQNWLLARSDEPESRIGEHEAQAHMAACDACRDAYESLRFVLSVTRSTAHLDDPPPRIDHLIMDMARKRESHRSWVERLQTFFLLPVPATVIALVFVASFTLLYYTKHGELRSTKSETTIIQSPDQPSESPGAAPADESSALSVQPEARKDDDRLSKSAEKSVPAGSVDKEKNSRTVMKKAVRRLQDAAPSKPQEEAKGVPMEPLAAGDGSERTEFADGALSAGIAESVPAPTPTPTPSPTSEPSSTPLPAESPAPTSTPAIH